MGLHVWKQVSLAAYGAHVRPACLRVHRHITALSERLQQGIMGQLDSVIINGPADPAHRYIGNLNLSFAYVEGESLIMGLKVRKPQLLQSLVQVD